MFSLKPNTNTIGTILKIIRNLKEPDNGLTEEVREDARVLHSEILRCREFTEWSSLYTVLAKVWSEGQRIELNHLVFAITYECDPDTDVEVFLARQTLISKIKTSVKNQCVDWDNYVRLGKPDWISLQNVVRVPLEDACVLHSEGHVIKICQVFGDEVIDSYAFEDAITRGLVMSKTAVSVRCPRDLDIISGVLDGLPKGRYIPLSIVIERWEDVFIHLIRFAERFGTEYITGIPCSMRWIIDTTEVPYKPIFNRMYVKDKTIQEMVALYQSIILETPENRCPGTLIDALMDGWTFSITVNDGDKKLPVTFSGVDSCRLFDNLYHKRLSKRYVSTDMLDKIFEYAPDIMTAFLSLDKVTVPCFIQMARIVYRYSPQYSFREAEFRRDFQEDLACLWDSCYYRLYYTQKLNNKVEHEQLYQFMGITGPVSCDHPVWGDIRFQKILRNCKNDNVRKPRLDFRAAVRNFNKSLVAELDLPPNLYLVFDLVAENYDKCLSLDVCDFYYP